MTVREPVREPVAVGVKVTPGKQTWPDCSEAGAIGHELLAALKSDAFVPVTAIFVMVTAVWPRFWISTE